MAIPFSFFLVRKQFDLCPFMDNLNVCLFLQSPDGDLIDCVPSHLQPAFDHPMLRGHKLQVTYLPPRFLLQFDSICFVKLYVKPVLMLIQDPPEMPKSYNFSAADGGNRTEDVVMQTWHAAGEACPEGTVAIRRTTEKDLLRASSLRRYGRKPARRGVRRDSTSNGHEVGLVKIIFFILPRNKELNGVAAA